MKVAIVGAGFTGLAAAWDLVKAGHTVTVYESNLYPGGLAAGFTKKEWQWSLEHHYHHIFTSDKDIIGLVNEIGGDGLIFFKRVRTATYYEGQIFQLDSPISLLLCPALNFITKMRTAGTLAFLKLFSTWKWLETMTAKSFLLTTMGKQAWQVIWEPLFVGKFGKYADVINGAWFWARIHVRSAELGYFRGGFGQLATEMTGVLENKGVDFLFDHSVEKIKKDGTIFAVSAHGKVHTYDAVLVTLPAHLLHKMAPSLPAGFTNKSKNLEGLGAVTLVLELDKQFFSDDTYWLNINQVDWPFLAVVEHTHFVDKKNYGNKSIVYIGQYCEPSDTLFSMDADEIFKKYRPYLRKLSKHFEDHVTQKWVFKAPFAQPIVRVNHSQKVPGTQTPIEGLYWASMQHVYPFDRGTNYAVGLGREVAQQIMNHDKQG